MNDKFQLNHHLSNDDINSYKKIVTELKNTPIPDNEILANLGLFLTRSSIGRIMFFQSLYEKIVNHHGIVMEFGVRWGQTLALLTSMRSLYEPYNTSRRIVGFDTFEGFVSVDKKDGGSDKAKIGSYTVAENYIENLTDLLTVHENLAPKSNLKKFDLVKGDVSETLPSYLQEHPETIISLAYFDLDLYAPTKVCLESILPYCTSNTVLAFDELCYRDFPGETIAIREVLDSRDYSIHRLPISPQQSYILLH